MVKQDYTYALNSDNMVVSIKDAIMGQNYRCPFCKSDMIQRKGEIRRWHFAHKANASGTCSYESYLHELAKVKIRQAFMSSDYFTLSYEAKAICCYECSFKSFQKCDSEKTVEFNLRKFYDTCEIEAPYHKFRADLLLTSSTNPKTPPLLIEIMVTHRCTQEKISDGVRIIEIPIHSEEQIDEIINTCRLTAVRNNRFDFNCLNDKEITLYNFNKIETFDPSEAIIENADYFSRKNTVVFCLNKHGQFYSFDCHCFEVCMKLPPNVHYFVSNIRTPFKEIFQGFSKRGVKIRNCFLCKFSKQGSYGDRLCVLYKKHNLPRKPSAYYATSCPHYREDFDAPKEIVTIERSQLIEQIDYFQGHKFYFYICNDIL